MNVSPGYRTQGVRVDGTTTEPVEHISFTAATNAVHGLRRVGLVPQLYQHITGKWLPVRPVFIPN